MNKALKLFTLLSLFSLTGCTENKNQEIPSENQTSKDDTSKDDTSKDDDSSKDDESKDDTKSKALVVYFSATNHTESVATTISSYINSPIYKLEPVNPYTSEDLNYSNSNSRVVKEYETTQRGERVNVSLTQTKFEEFDDAKYIFLGAPVWWRQLSWVVENFVSDNDFSNKTIIPFGTSSSSSFSLDNLTPLTNNDSNVTWLNPQRFSSYTNSSSVTNWIDSLNLDL